MKKTHYFIYGLLTGAVLVLSSIILVQSVDTNRAQAQASASNTPDIAMVSAQYQQSEHILYVATKNTNGEPVLMAYAAPSYNNFGLLGARSLQYDREMTDFLAGRPRAQGSKTSPPVSEIRQAYEESKRQNTKK